MSIEILYEDAHLLAVNKPAGLLSVPGIGEEKRDCLIARMMQRIPEARIVHRLDRDTSGVMVLARDADTHRELSRQFQDREVVKRYVAVVAGHVEQDEGEIDLPLGKDPDPARKPRQLIDHEHGRWAITRWRVLERAVTPLPLGEGGEPAGADEPGEGFPISRLQLQPITGRSHQLRLHLQTIGHPILGDDLYAPPEVLAAAERLLLHATYLMVTDPYTAAPHEFRSTTPF